MSEEARLLLVEDEALIGEMIKLNLEHHGYGVTWVRDGTRGADEALSGKYDLALLDLMLPGQSGVEITRMMREKAVPTPVIMLTAVSTTSSKVEGLDAGADDYLTKPFEMPELLARVRALLRRRGEK